MTSTYDSPQYVFHSHPLGKIHERTYVLAPPPRVYIYTATEMYGNVPRALVVVVIHIWFHIVVVAV